MARNACGQADWHARNVENAEIYANEEVLLVPVVITTNNVISGFIRSLVFEHTHIHRR